MSNHNDYSVRIIKTKTNLRTFFEVMLYDANYTALEKLTAKNRLLAYFSSYNLVVKHCNTLPLYDRFYLAMRLVGYYFYLIF